MKILVGYPLHLKVSRLTSEVKLTKIYQIQISALIYSVVCDKFDSFTKFERQKNAVFGARAALDAHATLGAHLSLSK